MQIKDLLYAINRERIPLDGPTRFGEAVLDHADQWPSSFHAVSASRAAECFCLLASVHHRGHNSECLGPHRGRVRSHRTRDNPLVAGAPSVRFMAATPLLTAAGKRLGMLCVSISSIAILHRIHASIVYIWRNVVSARTSLTVSNRWHLINQICRNAQPPGGAASLRFLIGLPGLPVFSSVILDV